MWKTLSEPSNVERLIAKLGASGMGPIPEENESIFSEEQKSSLNLFAPRSAENLQTSIVNCETSHELAPRLSAAEVNSPLDRSAFVKAGLRGASQQELLECQTFAKMPSTGSNISLTEIAVPQTSRTGPPRSYLFSSPGSYDPSPRVSLAENLQEDPRPCRPPSLSPIAAPQTLQPFSALVISNPLRRIEPKPSQTVDKLNIPRPVPEGQTDPFRPERICESVKEDQLSLRKGLRRCSLVSIQDPLLSKRKKDSKSQLSFTSRTSKVLSKSDSKTIEGILASISNRSAALRPHTDSSSQIGRSFLKPRASRKEASENAYHFQNS